MYGGFLVWQWDMAASEFETENWYLWCIPRRRPHGGGRPGADPAMTLERKKSPRFENPAEVIGRLGVDAATVEHVVLTHLHWDHAGGVRLFPRATFYLQESE